MKLKLLQHLSGATAHAIGDEIEVTDAEAVRMIGKGIAEAKTPKQHEDLMARFEKAEKEEAEKTAKLLAIQKEDELKGEADALFENLVAIITTIGANDAKYADGFVKKFQEKFKKGN